MTAFDHPEFDGHEQVLFCHDGAAGLRAIVAVHDTTLGPAVGGCRMHPYATTAEALADVLRLSRGMTFKNAVAGLPLGGGKAVIVGDPAAPGKDVLLRAFGRHVQALGGRYWTSIDVGVHPHDADVIAEECAYVIGRAAQYPGGENPSHMTSLGGLAGIRAAVAHTMLRDDLRGVRVAVQGLGNTGRELCRLLHDEGADLVVADIDDQAVRDVVHSFGAGAVPPDLIHEQDVDVFAPCALGGVLNDDTIPQLKARIVCGLANNQLRHPHHGAVLREAGITYVPDYVVNAGGMIGVAALVNGSPEIGRAHV